MRGWSSITIWTGTLPLHITRTCGDDPVLCSFFFWDSIYYPHMRGWSWLEKIRFYPEIILPAHAGMILTGTKFSVMNFKYYPHMRGWSSQYGYLPILLKILPAHAGMIPFPSGRLSMISYITRTCGDDPAIENMTFKTAKYYPHMRGWSSG